MHFRNFNYSFSSLVACVANSDIFSQSEARVRLLSHSEFEFSKRDVNRDCFFFFPTSLNWDC